MTSSPESGPLLSVVVPCYYNEANLPDTFRVLLENESRFPAGVRFEYVFVDDGSGDGTLKLLLDFHRERPDRSRIVKLSGNFGSHNALLAGLAHATGDCAVMLAADLQDPPELIPRMFEHWQRGVKLVLAHRQDREESLGQRLFSGAFHFLMRRYALRNVPPGGFDLMLFDRQLRDELLNMREKNTHLMYLVAWLRFEAVSIPYTRRKRDKGRSRWTLSKKIKLLIDSLVSFSFLPIRLISAAGMLLGFLALVYAAAIIVLKITRWADVVSGWSSLMVVLLFVSSFQMIALGIIGEYVWRAMDAARGRPPYVVDRVWGSE